MWIVMRESRLGMVLNSFEPVTSGITAVEHHSSGGVPNVQADIVIIYRLTLAAARDKEARQRLIG
jgi:hypothetical protein